MSLTLTLLALALGTIAFALWSERRAYEPGALRPPATLLLAAGMILGLLMLAHLVSLATGTGLVGRWF